MATAEERSPDPSAVDEFKRYGRDMQRAWRCPAYRGSLPKALAAECRETLDAASHLTGAPLPRDGCPMRCLGRADVQRVVQAHNYLLDGFGQLRDVAPSPSAPLVLGLQLLRKAAAACAAYERKHPAKPTDP